MGIWTIDPGNLALKFSQIYGVIRKSRHLLLEGQNRIMWNEEQDNRHQKG
jgi:hypothetical protein